MTDHPTFPAIGRPVDELVAEVNAQPSMKGADLTSEVTTSEVYEVPAEGETKYTVVAYDLGIKTATPGHFAARGIRTVVVPAHTPFEDLAQYNPDGVFLSNGPGDPAVVGYATDAIRELLGEVPIFGICLGHQLLATALGARTRKLAFGHHGGNHPVRRLATGQVEITSQNHNYAVAEDSLGPAVEVTHVNLNDGVVEGIRAPRHRAFGVQYHPEAGPGPGDARYLFDEFAALIDGREG